MKKICCFVLCILSMVFLSSCKNDSDISDGKFREDDNEFAYLEQVANIELDDVVKNSYLESIYVNLDKEDIEVFKKIVSEIEKSETEPVAKPFYSLTFYDENKDVIDVWEVYDAYTVKTNTDIMIARQDELSEWLDTIENKYNITFEIFNRTPAQNYLEQLEQADNAYITEITDNNFISGVSCNLEQDDLLSFKLLKDNIQIAKERQDIKDYYYQISFFDNNGGQLYTFVIDSDGKIYTSAGFEVTNQEAIDWFRNAEQNYKLLKVSNMGKITEYFNSVTDDMLMSCDTYPTLDAYWKEPLVLLNEFNDAIRLYGISAGEDSAMLLYVNDEKVLVPCAFKNFYQELPKLNSSDIDNDGTDEIVISIRTGTGSPGHWYTLLVCDYTGAWSIYEYDDYAQDIDKLIDYQYDNEDNTIILDKDGESLTEIKLPEWTEEYPYQGVIDFENAVRFDAETMKMEITPWILLEDSLPYTPVSMVFSVEYMDGKFEIEYQHIVESEDV